MFKDISRFFGDLSKRLKAKRFSGRAVAVSVLCIALVLVPTLLAIWQAYHTKDTDFLSTDEINIVLSDEEGNLIKSGSALESNLSTSSFVNMFYSILSKKTAADGSPAELCEPNYRLGITYKDSSENYICYFTDDAALSYMSDESGNFYLVEPISYGAFLASDLSEPAYASSVPPTLTINRRDTITPSEVIWEYKKADGSFTGAVNSFSVTDEKLSYDFASRIQLNFDTPPDLCSITVNNGEGNEVYSGDLAGISNISVGIGESLSFKVNAIWERKDNIDFYGEASYEFDIVCKGGATFSIDRQIVVPGDFITIYASNVTEGSSISYSPIIPEFGEGVENNVFNADVAKNSLSVLTSADAALDFLRNFKPEFVYASEAYRLILLPIPYGTPSGEFTFTISSGVSSQDFKVTVSPRPAGQVISTDKTESSISNAVSSDSLQKVDTLLSQISADCYTYPIFNDEFSTSVGKGYSLKYSYGDTFSVNEKPIEDFFALGNAYYTYAAGGAAVTAVNVGRVIYTGYTPCLGNFAVIDHGMGIATWYCYLDDFDVSVGDTVARGQAVGKSGEGNVVSFRGVLILCSVGDVLVNPSSILGNKIINM